MHGTRIVNALEHVATMPLGSNLAADLQAVWDAPPASISAAAAGAAQAYYDYVSGCTFGASAPTNITTANRDAMAAVLEAALSPNVMATAAASWSAGLIAFWTGVLVAGGSGNGPADPPAGAAALPAALMVYAVVPAPDTATGAANFASAVDIATRLQTATLTLPPGGPVVWPIA